MNILVANFGNDSLGLIEYAYQQKLVGVQVVSVDTGWSNPQWDKRVQAAEAWVRRLGFKWVRLTARLNFPELVRAQAEFPTTKFQWCAIYLKGDTLRAWLADIDPLKKATVLLARRRDQSPKFKDLPQFVDEPEEAFDDRRIWHPLYLTDEAALRALIEVTPFDWITHRSLECDPCVNSDAADLQRLTPALVQRLSALELEMAEPFLPAFYNNKKTLQDAQPYLKPRPAHFLFDMGCGSPYGCGL